MNKKSEELQQLITLDYDAIEGYDEAIKRIADPISKAKLAEFRGDHVRHTENLAAILREWGEDVPDGPGVKRFLTEGKVKIADLAGDKAILQAMRLNEKVTNEAYEKAMKLDDLDAASHDALKANFEDEQQHKAWIETRIEQL